MSEAEAHLALAERYIDALTRCDVETVLEIYAPDARLWHNFDQALQSVEDNIRSLKWMHRRLDNMHYDIVRREPIPGGFYQQHVLRGTLPSGKPFALPACAIIKIENNRIVSLDEYLDLSQTKPLTQDADSPAPPA